MDITPILLILLIIFFLPVTYVQYFLIIELNKKLGRCKFIVALICYLILWILTIQLLTDGYINLAVLSLIHALVLLGGVYSLKKEFMLSSRNLLNVLKGKGRRDVDD